MIIMSCIVTMPPKPIGIREYTLIVSRISIHKTNAMLKRISSLFKEILLHISVHYITVMLKKKNMKRKNIKT